MTSHDSDDGKRKRGAGSRIVGRLFLIALSSLSLSVGFAADYTNYIRLFTFSGTNGSNPQSALMEGSDHRLYGTTSQGGLTNSAFPDGMGVVFRIAQDGSGFEVLHFFGSSADDGRDPRGSLVKGRNGSLYGVTRVGGSSDQGTIFRMSADGSSYSALKSFAGTPEDGGSPLGGLLSDGEGTLFGTTTLPQRLFRINEDGTGYEVISHLATPYGGAEIPSGNLVLDANHNLWGTSESGWRSWLDYSENTYGTIFTIRTTGASLGIYDVPFIVSIWAYHTPNSLVHTAQGIFGTILSGGSGRGGGVFQVSRSQEGFWGFQVLKEFAKSTVVTNAWYPCGVVQNHDGLLYGTLSEGAFLRYYNQPERNDKVQGAIFRLNPSDANDYRILKTFWQAAGEGCPRGNLFVSNDGNLYGTTAGGNNGHGSIFALYSLPRAWIRFISRETNQTLSLVANAPAGVQFSLQSRTNLALGPWTLAQSEKANSHGQLVFTNVSTNPSQQFFRLVTE